MSALLLAGGCRKMQNAIDATRPPSPPIPETQSTGVPSGEDSSTEASNCYAAEGAGTVPPTISIHSLIILVDGEEQKLDRENPSLHRFGEEVQISEVVLCVSAFNGAAGDVCVDLAPLDQDGQKIMSQHKGTHMVSLRPGLITFSDLNMAWAIEDGWSGIHVVVNHWPREPTEDLDCANRACERDDWMVIPLQ
jgi:hypothetical protein